MLMLATGAAAWGWSHPYTTTAANIVTPSPTAPVACTILKPDTAITPAAVGSNCGFKVTATDATVDCRSVADVPSSLVKGSWNVDKATAGGGAGVTFSSAGCHMTSPAYDVYSYMESKTKLDPGNALMVVDFAPIKLDSAFGFLYGCDDTGCVDADFRGKSSTINLWDDSNQLQSPPPTVVPASGANRLMIVVKGKNVAVWFNGTLVFAQDTKRVHKTGDFYLFAENFEKTQPIDILVTQFAVYTLA
jgi:hypothetical protein